MGIGQSIVVRGAALVFGVALSSCSTSTKAPAPGADAPIPVAVATVAATDIAGTFEAGGVVEARTTATLMARIVAPVQDVRVAPGDRVRTGQVLIVLDGRELRALSDSARASALASDEAAAAAASERQAAEAALTLARATHRRLAGLHDRRSATPQELDAATGALHEAEARAAAAAAQALAARARVDSARAAGTAAATTASFAQVTAPFDGVITDTMVEPGNMAAPGTPLVRVEDSRQFRLDVQVDESRLSAVSSGALVPVTLDSTTSGVTTEVTGTVTEVARAAAAETHAFTIKITLPDTPGLRSGLFGRAHFTAPARRGIVVPSDALVRHGQVRSVFVVDNGVARVRLVNVSGQEVLAGLSEGDIVITRIPPALRDGQRVTVGGQ